MKIRHFVALAFCSPVRVRAALGPTRQFGFGGRQLAFALLLPVMCLRAAPGDVDIGFDPKVDNTVLSIAVQADRKIMLGGAFTSVGSTTRNYIARVNADSTLDTGFDPKVSGDIFPWVNAVAVQTDGKILLGGSRFTSVGGTLRNGIARINPDGTLNPGFDPNVTGGKVDSVAIQADGDILVGGIFTRVDGTTRYNIARVNADGMLEPGFDPIVNSVESVAVQADGKIVIGGYFTNVDSTARDNIARLNADGKLDYWFNPSANGEVHCVAVQADGRILLGGVFTSVGGTTRNRIARVNADGALDTGFDPNANGRVMSMAVQADGKILLSGDFTSVGGVPRNHLARLNADGTLDTGFDPNVNDVVLSVAVQADGKILLGGIFTNVGGVARNWIARLTNDAATQTLAATSETRVQWLRGSAAPEVSQVTFELSTNGGTIWIKLGDGTRISGGWELTGLALPPSGLVRARGRTTGGNYNGSSGLVEQVQAFPASAAPVFAAQPLSQRVAAGQSAQFTATASPAPTLQWQRNGSNLAGKTGTTLTIMNVQPASTGIYTAVATSSGSTTTSDPAILGVLGASAGSSETAVTGVIGDGSVVLVNTKHPNGKSYDQVLMTGAASAVTPVAGRVTRTSFIDLDDDIVQVEFAGAGTLSLVLDNSSPPAKPVNYTQNVDYMKGHVGIVIAGADETTNVSVFSVGRATAYDPTPGGYDILQSPTPPGEGGANDPAINGSSLFVGHSVTTYDGVADIAFIAISSTNGRFGGVRTANANYFAHRGLTGVYAPGVKFEGPIYLGGISAYDDATPVIVIGSTTNVTQITGGDLYQDNGAAVRVSGLTQLKFVAGQDSHGKSLPAQTNQAALQQDDVNVTAQIVVNP